MLAIKREDIKAEIERLEKALRDCSDSGIPKSDRGMDCRRETETGVRTRIKVGRSCFARTLPDPSLR